MICPNCGANVPENFTFCTYCGTPVRQTGPYGNQPQYAQPQWQEPEQQWEQDLWQQEQPTQQWSQPQWQQPVQQWDQNQWPQEQWNQNLWTQMPEKPRKRGKIVLISAIAAVVLVAVILGAALLLSGGGTDAAREPAEELLGAFLLESDVDALMERSAPCEEELEEDLRWSYEEVLLLLDAREVKIQTSGLVSEARYEEGHRKYSRYAKALEERYGFEKEVKAFCEYTFTVAYSSADTDSGEAAVTVCMAQVGGKWLLVTIDAEALLDAIAGDSTK